MQASPIPRKKHTRNKSSCFAGIFSCFTRPVTRDASNDSRLSQIKNEPLEATPKTEANSDFTDIARTRTRKSSISKQLSHKHKAHPDTI